MVKLLHETNNNGTTVPSAQAAKGNGEARVTPSKPESANVPANTNGNEHKTISLREFTIAVGKAEGAETKGSLAQRNLNWCNIRKACTAGKANGFGKCATAEDGWKLCEKTLTFYISKGRTLAETIRYFSPASDGNNPAQHVANIAKLAGIPTNTPLNQLIK